MNRTDEIAEEARQAGLHSKATSSEFYIGFLAHKCAILEKEISDAREVICVLESQIGLENLEGTSGYRGGPS